MSFRNAAKVAGTSLFIFFASVALAVTGCSSGSNGGGGTGGSGAGGKVAGAGGKVGGVGGSGMGGLTGAGGSPQTPACTPFMADPTMGLLFDFTDPTKTSFGDYQTMFSGSLFTFNQAAVDASTGAWHIVQDVTDYGNAGLGLGFLCEKADLSAFTGVAFDVAGTYTVMAGTGDAGAPPPNSFTFSVGTSPDDVNSLFNSGMPTWGTCVPTSGNQYDGSCASPSRAVALTAGPTLVTQSFTWAQISGGKGQPNGRATPDPTQISGIRWLLPWSGAASAPYHVDMSIDNIRLTTAGGGGTDSGTTPTDSGTTPTDTGTTPPDDAAAGN
jgi:hypothetical protein